MDIDERHWDAIVVGTGFGGSMVALELARAGLSVLVLDRGRWVDRDDSAWDTRAIHVEHKYRGSVPFEAPQFAGRALMHTNDTVGGSSVFYGAASFRMREMDFQRRSAFEGREPVAAGYVDWPIDYADLAPFYDRAENDFDRRFRLLGRFQLCMRPHGVEHAPVSRLRSCSSAS